MDGINSLGFSNNGHHGADIDSPIRKYRPYRPWAPQEKLITAVTETNIFVLAETRPSLRRQILVADHGSKIWCACCKDGAIISVDVDRTFNPKVLQQKKASRKQSQGYARHDRFGNIGPRLGVQKKLLSRTVVNSKFLSQKGHHQPEITFIYQRVPQGDYGI